MGVNKNFNFNAIVDFDQHINASIPNYAELENLVVSLVHHVVPNNGTVVDLGCSTGSTLIKIGDSVPNIHLVGVDIADKLFIKDDRVEYKKCDLNTFTPVGDVGLFMFTLQFLPHHTRVRLLREAKQNNMRVIVSEKVYMEDGMTQEMFSFSYLDYKSKNFTSDELLEKQRSIRTIMKPMTERENMQMFAEAGFTHVVRFWQSLQFVGWLMI